MEFYTIAVYCKLMQPQERKQRQYAVS